MGQAPQAGAAPSVHPVSAFHKWKALTAGHRGPCSNSDRPNSFQSALFPNAAFPILQTW